MARIIFFMLFCAFSLNLHATNSVDVYGVDLRQSEDLIKNFGSQAGDIEAQFLKEIIKISNGSKDESLMKTILYKKNQLIKKIQQQYNLAYVQFDTVFYPNTNKTYTTIEVINQHDKDRLRFIQKKNEICSTTQVRRDLIDKMIEFQDIESNILLTNQLNDKEAQCPVYHCLPGFNHPKLRDSFDLLTLNASKEKELLIKTLNNDPISQRRTAAIYLIGHLNDPHEIISLLTNHVTDSNDGVRNSAMRVISETMRKANLHEINVIPFLNLLDSPFDTDRNKALLVLLNAANSALSKQLIIENGHKNLISLLRLKQPNNHDAAYALLKKISNKDFGSHNIDAWKKWLLTMHTG